MGSRHGGKQNGDILRLYFSVTDRWAEDSRPGPHTARNAECPRFLPQNVPVFSPRLERDQYSDQYGGVRGRPVVSSPVVTSIGFWYACASMLGGILCLYAR